MAEYLIKSIGTGNTIRVAYSANGVCCEFAIESELPKEKQLALLGAFPVQEDMIEGWRKSGKFQITEIETDLSFENFWLKYNYKHGKKAAEKAYIRLTKTQRAKAITMIKRYQVWASTKGIALQYAATYINQETFEDEFK